MNPVGLLILIRFRPLANDTVSHVPLYQRYSPCQFDTEVAGSEEATTGTVARAIMPWVALHVDGTVHEPNVTMAVIKQTSSPHLVGSSTINPKEEQQKLSECGNRVKVEFLFVYTYA